MGCQVFEVIFFMTSEPQIPFFRYPLWHWGGNRYNLQDKPIVLPRDIQPQFTVLYSDFFRLIDLHECLWRHYVSCAQSLQKDRPCYSTFPRHLKTMLSVFHSIKELTTTGEEEKKWKLYLIKIKIWAMSSQETVRVFFFKYSGWAKKKKEREQPLVTVVQKLCVGTASGTYSRWREKPSW